MCTHVFGELIRSISIRTRRICRLAAGIHAAPGLYERITLKAQRVRMHACVHARTHTWTRPCRRRLKGWSAQVQGTRALSEIAARWDALMPCIGRSALQCTVRLRARCLSV